MCHWHFRFKETDRFVPEKTDSSAGKARQFRARDELITRHQVADFIEWIDWRFESPLIPTFNNSDFAPVALNDRPRFESGEREPSRHIIFFRRLKEEAVIAAIKFF